MDNQVEIVEDNPESSKETPRKKDKLRFPMKKESQPAFSPRKRELDPNQKLTGDGTSQFNISPMLKLGKSDKKGSSIVDRSRLANEVTSQYRRERGTFKPTFTKTATIVPTDVHIEIGEDIPDEDNIVAKVNGIEITQADVSNLVTDLSEDLVVRVQDASNYTYYKSLGFKTLDNVVYISLQLISFAAVIIGLIQGSSSDPVTYDLDTNGTIVYSVNNDYNMYFFILSVMSGVNIFLVEITKRYKFGDRAVTLYECVQEFDSIILEIKELRVDPRDPREKLSIIKMYERKLDGIELRAFDSGIIGISQHRSFDSLSDNKDNKGSFNPIRPKDIPVEE